MVRFSLEPGQISGAVSHRTVEEVWYVQSGVGRLWRLQAGDERVMALEEGVCVTIPLGTRFQFRNDGDAVLAIVAVTMPPWPGDEEAIPGEGLWTAGPCRSS